MSVPASSKYVCIFVASDHDSATSLLKTAANNLASAFSKTGYEVIRLFGKDAEASALYATLKTIENSGKLVALISFSSHAADDGIYDANGEVIADKNLGKAAKGAIAIVQGCLINGNLPRRWTSSSPKIEGCLGYIPMLTVPIPSGFQRILHPKNTKRVLEDFEMCICFPGTSLLAGETIGAACTKAVRAWRNSGLSLAAIDMRSAMVFELNAKCLSLWDQHSHVVRLKK